MIVSALFLAIILGVLVKAVLARYLSAALLALALGYMHLALVIRALAERTLPGADEAIRHDVRLVVFGLVVVPAAFWAYERRHAEGTPRREVADLVMLLSILTIAQLLWAIALV